MTVAELVSWLQKQPQDAVVIYQACSSLWDLEESKLDVYAGRIEMKERGESFYGGLIRHHDTYMVLDERWLPDWEKRFTYDKPELKYVTAVAFPGN